MTKEKLIEELTTKANETARMEKKSRQFLLIFAPLVIVFFIIYTFAWFDVVSMQALGGLFILLIFALFACGNLLPFGKISEEKVKKYFKDKLSQRIKDNEEELVRVSSRKEELNEDLKILKEL